jgi:hypothetical protein
MSPAESLSGPSNAPLPPVTRTAVPLTEDPSGQKPAIGTWPAWVIAFCVAFAFFAATVAPDVLMMDSGEYHWSTWLFPRNNLPQGPQNLVRMHVNYLMTAKVFALLIPLGNWFLRINLFSALNAAITAGNISLLTFALTRSRAATVLAFLSLVLGQTFWQYSVIAEVLTFQAATLTAEILLLYLWTTSGRFSWLLVLWLVNGYACGAHVQNGLASPVYLVITVAALWKGRVRPWQALACAAAWMAAYSPYLVFCLRHVEMAGGWRASLTSATAGDYGGQMWQVNPWIWLRGILYIGLNYPTGLALLCFPGLVALYKAHVGRSFKWGLLGATGANFLFAMTYNVPDQQSFFIPTYAALTVLIGLGASLVLRHPPAWTGAFLLAVLPVPIYAVLPTVLQMPEAQHLPVPHPSQSIAYRDPYEFYLKPWKTGRHNERRYIEETLAVLPERSIFLCSSTIREGMRAVQVVESRHPQLLLDPSMQSLAANLEHSLGQKSRWQRPVFLWAPRGSGVPDAFYQHCRLIPRGLIWEALPPDDAEGFLRDLRGRTRPGDDQADGSGPGLWYWCEPQANCTVPVFPADVRDNDANHRLQSGSNGVTDPAA